MICIYYFKDYNYQARALKLCAWQESRARSITVDHSTVFQSQVLEDWP